MKHLERRAGLRGHRPRLIGCSITPGPDLIVGFFSALSVLTSIAAPGAPPPPSTNKRRIPPEYHLSL